MDYLSLITGLCGGLGLFLYGMHIMAAGLQKAAGGKLKKVLEILTKNRLIGIIVGALVTAVIQSSSATTVMVVGFVNAGLMNLTQAVGIIMGANIGTTMTSWLVSSADLNTDTLSHLLLYLLVQQWFFLVRKQRLNKLVKLSLVLVFSLLVSL